MSPAFSRSHNMTSVNPRRGIIPSEIKDANNCSVDGAVGLGAGISHIIVNGQVSAPFDQLFHPVDPSHQPSSGGINGRKAKFLAEMKALEDQTFEDFKRNLQEWHYLIDFKKFCASVPLPSNDPRVRELYDQLVAKLHAKRK